jgi:hypothetical protein
VDVTGAAEKCDEAHSIKKARRRDEPSRKRASSWPKLRCLRNI